MATIKYIIQSKTESSQVYVRLSAGREINIKKKTGLIINSKEWSDKTSLPKQTNAENKLLTSKLNKLKDFIYNKYNEDSSEGIIIDSLWLEKQINNCFNRIEYNDLNLIVNYTQNIIDNAKIRENRGGKIGLTDGTIKNYTNFRKIIVQYQSHINKQIRFTDINKSFCDSFKEWLLNEKKYSINYTGKQFEFLKTISIDAQKNDLVVTPYSISIKSFRESDQNRHIQTLSFEEIEKIYNCEMPSKHLDEVKKWILIGCYIGQRGSDLLNITKDNIRLNPKGIYIDIIQQKTNKNVTIGVSKDYIIDILLNHFPEKVSLNKINMHISKVCEIAEINEKVKGYAINEKTGIRELTTDYKYKFITSHSLRRSFATNFYKKIPTPILINITGHSTESMFLKYINKRADKDANADLFMDYFNKI